MSFGWSKRSCPTPKRGEVLVRVLAAGVSLPDVMMREGIHPETPRVPFTPGWDLVGVVDRLGDGVSGIEPGQTVAALPISGAYAESHLPSATPAGSGATRVGPSRGGQPHPELRHRVPDAASLGEGHPRTARPDPRCCRRRRHGAVAARAPRRARDVRDLFVSRVVHSLRAGGHPDRLQGTGFRRGDSPPHARRCRRRVRRHRWHAHLAFSKGSAAWREGGGLWPHWLPARGAACLGSLGWSEPLRSHRHFRAVHRWQLASSGPETGGPLQHPVARTAEAGILPTRSERPVRSPSAEEDQAARRPALPPDRGETGPGTPREGRGGGQARPRQRRLERATSQGALQGGGGTCSGTCRCYAGEGKRAPERGGTRDSPRPVSIGRRGRD
jgi:Alcohol dehydrogenase GroES-like domain